MQRDHLFNRSTRPLLDSPPKNHYHLPTATIIPQIKKQKSSTTDYKLHGFNDFNFVANQYKNLNNKHTGYPYGSPPSTPNTSVCYQTTTTYDDGGGDMNNQPYYDDDSGIHTNNSSENFSCHSNYSTTINYYEDPINDYHYSAHKDAQLSQKKGFFAEWSRFGNTNNHPHQKLTNETNQLQQNQRQMQNSKMNSPRPVNRLLDNGPFIFGVHSNTCYTLPSKVSTKCDSVIKNSTATSVLATKYTPIDPDANDDVDDDEHNIYHRCDSTGINDNAQNDTNKHMLATATVENASTKDHDRKHKKNIEKNRIKAEKLTKTKKKTKQSKKPDNAIKVVCVGDGTVGKTNLISAYLQHRFTIEHVPTASDIYNFEVKVDEKPIQVTLCDTAGQDFLDPLRRLCYPDSDVFVLCFSVIKPDTFVAVREKWMPIFRKSKTPIVLVGTQSDLRNDSAVISKLLAKNEKPVSKSDAWDYATSIGAQYIETSSRANINVKETFDTAIWYALMSINDSRKKSIWRRIFCLS